MGLVGSSACRVRPSRQSIFLMAAGCCISPRIFLALRLLVEGGFQCERGGQHDLRKLALENSSARHSPTDDHGGGVRDAPCCGSSIRTRAPPLPALGPGIVRRTANSERGATGNNELSLFMQRLDREELLGRGEVYFPFTSRVTGLINSFVRRKTLSLTIKRFILLAMRELPLDEAK